MSLTESATSTLNFFLLGNQRSGSYAVQTMLAQHREVVCHADVLDKQPAVSRIAHEAYFGPTPPGSPALWYVDSESNPYHYLNRQIFDNPRRNEKAVGIWLTYRRAFELQLYDLLLSRYREGDFCLIHVVRNPIACYASWQQALKSKRWALTSRRRVKTVVSRVHLDPVEVTEFARLHEAMRGKLREACPDILDINYGDLCKDLSGTARKLTEFLELKDTKLPEPLCTRIPNLPVKERIANFEQLRSELPCDVKKLLLDDQLI